MKWMSLVSICMLATFAAIAPAGPVQADLSGDEILAKAAAGANLQSYSVPVHFDVHMKRPIGVKAPVEGIMYYQSPAQAALVLTKVPGPIGQFFKGSYKLDMVPQTWPPKYTVKSVSESQQSGTPIYVLHAVPNADPDVDQVEFDITKADNAAVAVVWHYKDGSTIEITTINQQLSGNVLPQTQTISVTMPKYALEAAATYGEYASNAPIPAGIFNK